MDLDLDLDLDIDFDNKVIDYTKEENVALVDVYRFCQKEFDKRENQHEAIPISAVTVNSFEFINGWVPSDRLISKLRLAGMNIFDKSGNLKRQFLSLVSLGNHSEIEGTHQWTGELIEYRRIGMFDLRKILLELDKSYTDMFKTIGVDEERFRPDLYHVPGRFVSPKIINNIRNTHPEYFL